jgi:peptidoglycan biosynthesis protein MviN/MurJ (putative lipid II flippase)
MSEPTTIPKRRLLADITGLAVVAAQAALIAHWLIPADYRLLAVLLASLASGVCALWMWYDQKTAKQISDSTEWAAAIATSIVLGASSFAVDVMVGSLHNPGTSILQAAVKAGGPFGFCLTVLICPGFTMAAVAGFVRSLIWRTDQTAI